MTEDLAAAVRASEQQRCAAMLANDTTALDAILDPRLQFAHATGVVDDKSAYLTKMAGGRIVYVGIDWTEEVVIELAPGVALLTGRMATDVKVDGVDKALRNRVMSVWGKTDGQWRLVAFQSTPMAG
jgi:ketosteroid isomerase-like protein